MLRSGDSRRGVDALFEYAERAGRDFVLEGSSLLPHWDHSKNRRTLPETKPALADSFVLSCVGGRRRLLEAIEHNRVFECFHAYQAHRVAYRRRLAGRQRLA